MAEHPVESLIDDLVASIEVGTIPMFWGRPGVGKTAIIGDIGRRFGLPVYTLIGSLCDPTDVNGFPVVSRDRVTDKSGRTHPVLEFAPRSWLVELNKTGGILFFDELTSCPPAVQAALLRSMLDKVFGDYSLDPERVAMIAAGNSADVAANGQELPAPMINRLDHYQFPMEPRSAVAREWAENFSGYWGNPPVVRFGKKVVSEAAMSRARSYVAGYIVSFPDAWHAMPGDVDAHSSEKGDKKAKRATQTDDGQSGWPSPRSWDRVSRHVGRCIDANLPPIEAMRRVAAAVGDGEAIRFNEYVQSTAIPDPETVLKNPDKYEPSGRVDLDFATLAAVAGAVEADLTAARVLAGMQVISRAFGGRGNKHGNVAYESAAPAARRILKYMNPNKGGSIETLVKGMSGTERSKYLHEAQQCAAPFAQLMKSMNISFEV